MSHPVYLIASDIHGSAYYAEELVDAFHREGADKLLLLGDILYHGPRNALPLGYDPKKVIALLNPLADKIVCCRGNCDAEVDQMVLDFPLMADYQVVTVDRQMLFLTHGHLYDSQNPPPVQAGDIVLQGHTHVPLCQHTPGGWWLLNPGSVSIPKEDSPHSYLLLKDGTFYWKTLMGEVYRTAPLFE